MLNLNPLQTALSANALFSLVSGSFCILGRDLLMSHIPLAGMLWTLLGAGLILFSMQLAIMVKNNAWADKLIVSVIYSDIAWVFVTFAALAYYRAQISLAGMVPIIAVNIVVAALAWFQAKGYQRQRTKIKPEQNESLTVKS